MGNTHSRQPCSLGFLRQKKRTASLFVDCDAGIADTAADSPPDIDDIPAGVVTEMIRHLPEGYRMVFNLYVIEGRSHKEISRMLGIKEDTSASQLHRAKAMLAKQITEYRNKSRQEI